MITNIEKIDLNKDHGGVSYSIQLQQMIKECAVKVNEIVDFLNSNNKENFNDTDNKKSSKFPPFRG